MLLIIAILLYFLIGFLIATTDATNRYGTLIAVFWIFLMLLELVFEIVEFVKDISKEWREDEF